MKLHDIRTLMAQYGLRPNKQLGQNFLIDATYLDKIVEAAALVRDDWVLEIGPGLGPLSERLLAAGANVVAVELDGGFTRILRDRFGDHPHFHLYEGDVLEMAVADLLHEAGAPPPLRYKCVANIPYYITSAVIRHLLEGALPPELLVLLMQKEVAERISAEAGDLSLLAVGVQFYGEPQIVTSVPAGAFYPRPKVESSVLRVRPYRPARYHVADPDLFWRVVKAGFGQKRKQLRNSLNAGLPQMDKDGVEAALAAAQIAPQRRAQTLTIDEWVALTDAVQDLVRA
ncbi:MAG: ribosomal RNA small subunit methyltransferase A [Anaerolineales bacterium]|nr:ribosomal RNA small subunit methyltransferase A [Anaerolineales bacterium]